MNDVPRLKGAILTGRLMLAIEPEIDQDLKDLKRNYDIDVSEWLRRLIRAELPKLKDKVLNPKEIKGEL